MENKFFLHRIRKDGNNYITGIEIHDTKDAAIQSYHAQMKMGYNNPNFPNIQYVSCMVTDGNDTILPGFNETWGEKNIQEFFVHYIRRDGETYTKGIDVCQDYNTARRSFHTQMEYGHGNSKFPNIAFVASKITGSRGFEYKSESWSKPEE